MAACPVRGGPSRLCPVPALIMFYDPEYMESVESMTLADDSIGSMEPCSNEVTSHIDELLSTLNQARLEWQARAHDGPEDGVRRAEVYELTHTENQSPNLGSSEVPTASEVVTDDNLEELLEPPALEMLKEWAKKMFNDLEGKVVDLSMIGRIYRETNGLIVNAKQAIVELFNAKAFKAALCCSPEREDLKLSQEEALGWLLAYARGRRLLEFEARPIGKYAGTQAAVAKAELDRPHQGCRENSEEQSEEQGRIGRGARGDRREGGAGSGGDHRGGVQAQAHAGRKYRHRRAARAQAYVTVRPSRGGHEAHAWLAGGVGGHRGRYGG